jgi:geranylgeranyl diphosphate synthase, type II
MLDIKALHAIFEVYMQKNRFAKEPNALYEPIDYILSIGGKRLRPLLALMGCNLFKSDLSAALPVAMAVEVFHNFSLLHDDIMDAAPLRRGKQTVHIKYGVNTGILSGDVMLIYAYRYLAECKSKELSSKLLTIFNKMATEVCEGQQYDMNFETQALVTIPEYIRMIEMKTAVLVAAAFQMGALAGKASDEVAFHLGEFGRCVGIAFQLQDDVLDTYGDPEKFGKKVGGDICQNKKTYLVLKTLELANETDKNRLNKLMNTPTDVDEKAKIEEVKQIFNSVNARQLAENLMNDYVSAAFAHLDAIKLAKTKKEYLKNWTYDLMGREH